MFLCQDSIHHLKIPCVCLQQPERDISPTALKSIYILICIYLTVHRNIINCINGIHAKIPEPINNIFSTSPDAGIGAKRAEGKEMRESKREVHGTQFSFQQNSFQRNTKVISFLLPGRVPQIG